MRMIRLSLVAAAAGIGCRLVWPLYLASFGLWPIALIWLVTLWLLMVVAVGCAIQVVMILLPYRPSYEPLLRFATYAIRRRDRQD